jgi:hypothetical protein
MKAFYLICCLLGIAIPYWQFLPWVGENGLALDALFAEAASTRVGAFAWLDVLVSAVVLLTFVNDEGRRLGMRRLWAPVIGTLTVGVSLGLPLFLFLRQVHLERRTASAKRAG